MFAFFRSIRRPLLPAIRGVRHVLLGLLFLLPVNSRAAVVAAAFNTATSVPVTANGYTAAGKTITLTLNFAPPAGTALTVVLNTSFDAISGTFDNLAQGQLVTLTYNGTPYVFAADYFGGTGNDLVLQWGATRMVAWGADDAGQLGNNSTTNSSVPVAVDTTGVLAGKTATMVATGMWYNLVLCSDGMLYSWGYNSSGQLGNGATVKSTLPVAVDLSGALAGKTVVSIACGRAHCLVLCSDGTLASWGSNSSGQLGNNSTTSSSVPVRVTTTGTVLENKTVASIMAGSSFSLVLCTDGTLAAWGNNSSGQLGNNSTTRSLVPVAVTTAGTPLQNKTVAVASAGNDFSLAVTSDGIAVAWGSNFEGKLGINSSAITRSLLPVAVATSGTALQGKTVKAVTASGNWDDGLALCTDGTLAAWGANESGELGSAPFKIGFLGGFVVKPVAVVTTGVLAGKSVKSLTAGRAFAEVLCSDGTTVTWGVGTSGQLGNNSRINAGVPVTIDSTGVLAGKTVTAVAPGYDHSLILCSDGTLAVWGDNTQGQLGIGSSPSFDTPVPMVSTGVLASKTVVRGAAGRAHSLLLFADGTLAACGDNGYGQLGLGSVPNKLEPWPVPASGALAGKTVVAVAAGDYHSLALCSDGTMASWGSGTMGQLGNNTLIDSNVPVAVDTSGVLAGKTVAAIATGRQHNLALCSDGTLVAWGDNGSDQLGVSGVPSVISAPILVTMNGALSGRRVVQIAAGDSHSLALCTDGTIAAWGNNGNGQLGNGSTNIVSTPVAVMTTGTPLEGKNIVRVVAEAFKSMALCSDGTLAAWGATRLGDGTTSDSAVPVLISTSGMLAGRVIQNLCANYSNALAVCDDGALVAWGTTLGTGTSSTVPVTVDASFLLAGERFLTGLPSTRASFDMAVVATPPPPPPTVATLAASDVTGTTAVLHGIVMTNLLPADVAFDFGTSVSYGGTSAGSPSTAPGGGTSAESAVITGLMPATTYHFRIKGTSSTGTTPGNDLTLTTLNNDATLSGLVLSAGGLSPAFDPATLAYTTRLPYSAASVIVTPSATDPHATIRVQGNGGGFVSVTAGSPSVNLALAASGSTLINVEVTAEDGSTVKTYAVTVAEKTPLEHWQQTHFGTTSAKTGLTEDFDGDGVSNLKEFAFGTNPADSSSNARPLSYSGNTITPGGTATEVIGGVPMAEFIRRSDLAQAGLTYTVQFSSKLKAWETWQGVPNLLATDGVNDVVGMPYPTLSDGVQARFFRVTVTVAP